MTSRRFEVHFGGPDRPAGTLRDLLAERLAGVPAGGSVDWATYYFRDRPLAQDLIDAAHRGVRVTLALEGHPRIARANQAVIEMLSAREALGRNLRVISMPGLRVPGGIAWKPQLHEKIYCFSDPEPVALVGSFNPSGDRPEVHPEIVQRIGDHHVAHNALVELRETPLVECLAAHVRRLHRDGPRLFGGFGETRDRDFTHGDTRVHFWPRRGPHPVERLLERYGAGSRVRIAASHIRNPHSVRCLAQLVRRGAQVRVTAEHTRRRVPRRVERRLASAGIAFERLGAAANVPMHLKFVLAEDGDGREAAFGSFNWTRPSYWLNHEVAVITGDQDVWDAFDRRWNDLGSQARDQ